MIHAMQRNPMSFGIPSNHMVRPNARTQHLGFGLVWGKSGEWRKRHHRSIDVR